MKCVFLQPHQALSIPTNPSNAWRHFKILRTQNTHPAIHTGSFTHQEFQVSKIQVLKLIRLFLGWVFPSTNLTCSLYSWGFLHFRYQRNVWWLTRDTSPLLRIWSYRRPQVSPTEVPEKCGEINCQYNTDRIHGTNGRCTYMDDWFL